MNIGDTVRVKENHDRHSGMVGIIVKPNKVLQWDERELMIDVNGKHYFFMPEVLELINKKESGMKIGDRVRITKGNGEGQTGTITRECQVGEWRKAWFVRVDGVDHDYDKWEEHLSVVEKQPKSDILEMAQRNRDAMLSEVADFRKAAEEGTLGDFSELGFLYHLLQALVRP